MEKPVKEMSAVDEYGNCWKLTMTKMETKTNRFQLSFWFNDKEFSLSKLQSNRSADDTWELLEKISKTPPKVKPSILKEVARVIGETVLVPEEPKLPPPTVQKPAPSSPSKLPFIQKPAVKPSNFVETRGRPKKRESFR